MAAAPPNCGDRPGPRLEPPPRRRRQRPSWSLLALLVCTCPTTLAWSAGAWAAPDAPSLAARRSQAEQAMARGDLRRGCPLLRRTIDDAGALYARSPSPALRQQLSALVNQLKPCLAKGL
ncbi:MAG: hypothetical protein ACKN89_05285 [Cyanobium sp.]